MRLLACGFVAVEAIRDWPPVGIADGHQRTCGWRGKAMRERMMWDEIKELRSQEEGDRDHDRKVVSRDVCDEMREWD
jgi:hypothetical protein